MPGHDLCGLRARRWHQDLWLLCGSFTAFAKMLYPDCWALPVAQVQNSFWLQGVKGRKLKDAQAALVAERLQDFVVYCTPNDAIMQESQFTSGPVTISARTFPPAKPSCAHASPHALADASDPDAAARTEDRLLAAQPKHRNRRPQPCLCRQSSAASHADMGCGPPVQATARTMSTP